MRADEMLDSFGLSGFGRRSPDTLSGGEAQRVSLARTLIARPQLVLFDEPLSSLDVHLRKRLADDIKEMQLQYGFTGIFVSHDIQEIKNICSHVTVMKEGCQTWTGSSEKFTDLLFR
jgi:ABC-type Fe3+/spermidine/putrescine transport system ATPase subunit